MLRHGICIPALRGGEGESQGWHPCPWLTAWGRPSSRAFRGHRFIRAPAGQGKGVPWLTTKKGPEGPFPYSHALAAYFRRLIVALLWPVATDFSPANGLSLRIIHGYFGQSPVSHGWSGWFSSSTRRASSARVLLPMWV